MFTVHPTEKKKKKKKKKNGGKKENKKYLGGRGIGENNNKSKK